MTDASNDFSPNLSLPFLLPAQAQKHVTVNEALSIVDALVMSSVTATNADAPPQSPQNGEAYVLSGVPAGEWQGHEGELAVWVDNAWTFYVPRAGWHIWDRQEGALLVYDGDAWRALTLESDLQNIVQFGVNTTADATNKLSVKSDSILFSHDDVTPGDGSARVAINKAEESDVASIVFQSDYLGRAEIGLSGENALSLRTSNDGASFTTGLKIDPVDASVVAPQGLQIGGSGDEHRLVSVKRGSWSPQLGSTKTGDFNGATGLSVTRAHYFRIGDLVHLDLVASVTGLVQNTFSQPSTLQIVNLPFLPKDADNEPDAGGVQGFAYQSIGGARNTAISGGLGRSGTGSIYLFVVVAAVGNAYNTSQIYLKATYLTDDGA